MIEWNGQIKTSRFVDKWCDQFASLLSHWERPCEGACISASLEQVIKRNMEDIGYAI